MNKFSSNIKGVGFLVLGMLIISLQSVVVKWIAGDYPLMEIVIIRCFVALPCILIISRFEGKHGLPTTQRYKLEFLRGFLLFLGFNTYFMGVAALPLADVASIRNSAPLIITFLSILLLDEKVGPRRWMAIIVGFIGVLLIVRPGSVSFNLGSVFVLIATFFYSLTVMVTRKLRTTDSSATMAYYTTLAFFIAAFTFAPLAIFVGEIPNAHPSIAFLFHTWAMPTSLDWAAMSGLGVVWAVSMYFIARAYSLAQASVAAPFEYVVLPINVIWGFAIWHEIPTSITWVGAFLTLFSGVYVLLREG